VVEQGEVEHIYQQPRHTYTQNLLAAIPGKKMAQAAC
jgi:oligopeptide transport system ATP-binding protein